MAEKIGSVWAIDIGNTSLKALRLSNESGALQVIGFDHIMHGKILSSPDVKDQEKQELIALSLRQFVQQNEIGKDEIIVSVPSSNSFARFVNLPPVEQKRIPEIVKFEASQQIPFDINQVVWDWQLMTEAGATEAKVGIFAIKNEVVTAELEHFSRENLQVSQVQIAPMALYNYIVFDRPDLTSSGTQATVVLNIGAENTDLVVCTKSDVWNRTIAMGGNAFTKAIADTFKLSFEKAEKLKRTAPMSKYARQILQAMKPVFADLAAEIQRSLGFYGSAHPNVKLARIVALGGGTKMRGLLQYLQQSLQTPIERPDAFKQVGINAAVSAAKFHESVCDFGIVYGLGIQSLGLGRLENNLLPRSVARSMVWAQKTKYFVAAACLILVATTLALARVLIDRASYSSRSVVRDKTKAILDAARKAESKLTAEQAKASVAEAIIKEELDLFKHRDIVPKVQEIIIESLPNEKNNPEQEELHKAFAAGDIEKIKETKRKERKQLFITNMSIYYTQNLETAQFGSVSSERRSDTKTSSGSGAAAYDYYQEMMRQASGGRSTEDTSTSQKTSGPSTSRQQANTPAGDGGFVVTIAGYSPYKEITELLDPIGIQDDVNKGGLVTRLMHLDNMFDGNSPLVVYKKTVVPQQFEIRTGEVDLSSTEMPAGIGIVKTTEGKETAEERIILDPMTKEVIGKEVRVDEAGKKETDRKGNPVYETNDHWFVVNFKLKWKDVPAAETTAAKTTSEGPKAESTRKSKPAKERPSSKSEPKAKSKQSKAKELPADF